MIQNIKNGLAVKGYDVVEFFEGQAILGLKNISSEYNGAYYLFSSIDNKMIFDKNPERYLPKYGGFCAIAMSEGSLSNPNPKSFKIQDGKLFLFTRMFWGIIDVKRKWNKNPEARQSLADKEWVIMNK